MTSFWRNKLIVIMIPHLFFPPWSQVSELEFEIVTMAEIEDEVE